MARAFYEVMKERQNKALNVARLSINEILDRHSEFNERLLYIKYRPSERYGGLIGSDSMSAVKAINERLAGVFEHFYILERDVTEAVGVVEFKGFVADENALLCEKTAEIKELIEAVAGEFEYILMSEIVILSIDTRNVYAMKFEGAFEKVR